MRILRAHKLAQSDVRPFAPVAVPRAVSAIEPDPAEALREELALLKQELADARKAADVDQRAARAAGVAEGKSAEQKDEASRVAVLAETAQAAAAAWAASLERTDALATRIAHAALAKLFDDTPRAGEFVLAALRRQLALLDRDSIIAIQVSAADFPGADALAAAAEATGASVATDSALAAGGCVIKLKLGELDIGLPTQWEKLSALLLDAAGEEAR